MRTLALALLLCFMLSGKAQKPVDAKETFLSLEQEFYGFGVFRGRAHKVFYISITGKDSVHMQINAVPMRLGFVKETYDEDDEETVKQYSGKDARGREFTVRMYYEENLLTDISVSFNYTSCHFYVIKSYSL